MGVDCCAVTEKFTVGRSLDCDLTINDRKISRLHFSITRRGESFVVTDHQSKNRTYIQGQRVEGEQPLADQTVIRIGQTVLVFHEGGGQFLELLPKERYGMAGRFHVGTLIRELKEASLSSRHMLIVGPSGSGKELAARALAHLMMDQKEGENSILSHNAARFASSEEAATTLFGVGSKIFSGVGSRPGLIEESKNGVLFLDEAHCLPERIQKSLLRVVEENETARIGETQYRPADVRFVFASNVKESPHGLVRDLRARLRLVRIPPLAHRLADIPLIFQFLLEGALRKLSVDPTPPLMRIRARHFESMMLDGFAEDNVRGVLDMADRIATRIAAGTDPELAINSVFAERFGVDSTLSDPPPPPPSMGASHYDLYREQIISVYRDAHYNLSATERALMTAGVKCSRRWLRHYLTSWGVYKGR